VQSFLLNESVNRFCPKWFKEIVFYNFFELLHCNPQCSGQDEPSTSLDMSMGYLQNHFKASLNPEPIQRLQLKEF